jgi:hypothetical protein
MKKNLLVVLNSLFETVQVEVVSDIFIVYLIKESVFAGAFTSMKNS